MLSVDILGTKYRIEICGKNDSELQADSDGYCISARHLIGIRNFEDDADWADATEAVRKNRRDHVVRHEILHAFFFESGLGYDSMDVEHWATNEEMVDWFAAQFPKIVEAYREADCLGSEALI